MVRGSAAVLSLVVGAALLVAADALPSAGTMPSACAGGVAIGLCALAPLPGRGELLGIAVFGLGAALLAIALNAADLGAEATPAEALFAAAAGLLFAVGFALPAAVVTLPLVVAGIDAASLLGGGAADLARAGSGSDVLTLDVPRWGGGDVVTRVNILDATFLALFAAWSLRYALRPRIALPLMVIALTGALALSVALERVVPAIPFLAFGFLLPAVDRLVPLLRSEA